MIGYTIIFFISLELIAGYPLVLLVEVFQQQSGFSLLISIVKSKSQMNKGKWEGMTAILKVVIVAEVDCSAQS